LNSYLTSFFLSFFAFLCFSAGVNYYVDPGELFRHKTGEYERGIAASMLEGYNVTDVGTYSDRFVNKYFIAGLTHSKDIVVLGSSRGNLIRSSFFSGKSFFNDSLDGASVEDFLSIIRLYQKRQCLPSEVIFVLDPWLLNRYSDQHQWKLLQQEYHEMSATLGLQALDNRGGAGPAAYANAALGEYGELLSVGYLRSSLGVLWDHWSSHGWNGTFVQTKGPIDEKGGILADGSVVHTLKEKQTKTEHGHTFIPGPFRYMDNFLQMDPERVKVLETLIAYLKKNNVRVQLCLTPFQPAAYQFLLASPEYHIALETENYFRELASRFQLPIRGSYDPSVYDCGDKSFYDARHPDDACVERIFLPAHGKSL
jgi:hypothetical protein